MIELYIFSQDDSLLTIITEDTGLVSAPYRNEVNSVPDTPFSFTVEADSDNAQYVKEENKVVYRDHEGDLRLVVIKELDDSDSIDGPETTGTCEPEFMELAEHIVVDRRFNEQTAQVALNAALEGTRYIGEVEVDLGLATDNFYYINSVDAVWKIIATWGGEFKDVVEFDNDNNIIARKIKLLQRLGKDHGQRFEIDHNITEIGRTVLSYPLTAIYGRGASLETEGGGHTRYIDFADVEWKKSNGDPVDKPPGQKWVGDPDALQVYGRWHNGKLLHREGIFSNQDYEDPEELLWATWQNLQANKYPEVNYRLSVDLFEDKVSLGDTAIAIDGYFSRPIEIQARVIAMEYDLLDIEGTMVVEMGQFLNLADNRLDDLERDIESLKNNRPSAQVTENSYPDLKPGTPVNLEAHGGIEVIQLYWDYTDEIYVKHYEVYGSQVKDFVPDSQHLLWRGDVSAFAHTVGTDQVWYYRVRAVNYHGTVSDWSVQVSTGTNRVISDDILFGSIIADHLSDNLDIAGKLAQNTIDRINEGPLQEIQYTQEEIKSVNTAINNRINSEISIVNGSITDLHGIADNLIVRTNEIDGVLAEHNGKFTDFQLDVDEIERKLSLNIEEIERIDGAVESNSLELTTTAEGINTRIDSFESNYASDKTGILSSIEQNRLDIDATAKGLELRVTQDELQAGLDGLEYENRNYFQQRNYSHHSNAGYSTGWTSAVVKIEPNTTYTISFTSTESNRFGVFQGNLEDGLLSNLINRSTLASHRSIDVGDRIVETVSTVGEGEYLAIYLSNEAGDIREPYLKVEKGTKATDWTPAPEDDLERISSITAELEVHAGLISVKAESSELNNYVTNSTYNNKIGQLDVSIDGITTNVSDINATVNTHTGEIESARSQISSVDTRVDGITSTVSDLSSDLTTANQAISQVEQQAGRIESTVGTIQTDVSGLEGEMTAVQTRFTQLPDEIELAVSEGIGGIQIGGRNLIPNSNDFSKFTGYSGASRTITTNVSVPEWGAEDATRLILSGGGSRLKTTPQIYANKSATVTYSFWAKNNGDTDIEFNFNGYNGVGAITFAPNESRRVVVTGVVRDNYDWFQHQIRTVSDDDDSIDVILWRSQLEYSNGKATDWSLAEEDRVNKTNVLSSINLSTEGVRIDGNIVHITGQTLIDDSVIGTAAIANAAITKAKLGTAVVGTAQIENAAITNGKIANATIDDAKIASLSATKLSSGEIDTDKIRISGGNATNYVSIFDDYIRSHGRFSRTWGGITDTALLNLGIRQGHILVSNEDTGYNLYMTERGLSTSMAGAIDEFTSGTLEFHSQRFNQVSRGVTLHSSYGTVAMVSDYSTIVSRSKLTNNVESDDYSVYIRPFKNTRPGLNEFQFYVKRNEGVYSTDGAILYGDITGANSGGSGIRFSKGANENVVYATNINGDINSADFSAANFRATYDFIGRNFIGSLRAPNTNIYAQTAYDGEFRVTDKNGYNNGNMNWRPVVALDFRPQSSERIKTEINQWEGNVLDTIVNDMKLYQYRLKQNLGTREDRIRHGVIIERETPESIIAGTGVDLYEYTSWAMKGLQEAGEKLNHHDDELSWLKTENQFLKNEITKLKEKIA